MNFEQPKQVPQEIIDYVEWWHKTYGRESTEEESGQLINFAKSLAEKDPEFKELLGKMFAKDFVGNTDGLEDKNRRKLVVISSLSKYAEKFGLQAD